MWLDYRFPWFKSELVLPNKTIKLKRTFEDLPSLVCGARARENILEVTANAEYILFLFVKPSGNSIPPSDSIWSPIQAFSWRWGGGAKNKEGVWVVSNSLTGEGFHKLEYNKIVQWSKVAVKENVYTDEDHIIIKWEPKQ